MEYAVEFGEIADALTGQISDGYVIIIEAIPQKAEQFGLALDLEQSRIERHSGGMRGGDVYVRYVLVAPEGVDEADWLEKAKKLEKFLRGFL